MWSVGLLKKGESRKLKDGDGPKQILGQEHCSQGSFRTKSLIGYEVCLKIMSEGKNNRS
jgi:hypothetical protein